MDTNNWVEKAADEVCYDLRLFIYTSDGGFVSSPVAKEKIIAAITRFSPFKQGVAYMPVPRCDSCANWCPVSDKAARATCAGSELTGEMTSADFGCVQWKGKP